MITTIKIMIIIKVFRKNADKEIVRDKSTLDKNERSFLNDKLWKLQQS